MKRQGHLGIFAVLMAAMAALSLLTVDADARAGRRLSLGNRGSRGFYGARLLGLLLGYGLFGGLGGFASLLGLVLQIAVIAVAARLIVTRRQRRQLPALAGAPRPRGLLPEISGLPTWGEPPVQAPPLHWHEPSPCAWL